MKKGLLIVLLLVVVMTGTVLGLWLPYQNAATVLPEGDFMIHAQEDGTLAVSWPEAPGADSYCLELLAGEKSVYRSYVPTNEAVLPQLPEGVALTMQVQSVGEYKILGSEYVRMGEGLLSVTTVFDPPLVRDQIWDIDTDTKTANVSFHLDPGDRCLCWREENGKQTLFADATESSLVIVFGQDLPVPELGETIDLDFYGYREQPGLQFYGPRSVRASVEREHLLSRTMELTADEAGENRYTLSWGEAKGENYQVQCYDAGTDQWEILATIPCGGERSFTTPRLPAGRELACRVVSVGGQTLPGSDNAAVSQEVRLKTEPSPIYTTVWPVTELTTFRRPDLSGPVGSVKTAKALWVLEEIGNAFAVQVDGEKVYIDSRYCLIDLPEYMGTLCSYNITNSYDSKYMVHEFEIPKVTGRVTKGYENVRLENGEFLVPLLYPTAQKLVHAAALAAEQGYRLKIYDAFRPNRATQDIYNQTSFIMDDPIPALPYTNVSRESLNLPAPQFSEEGGEGVLTYRMVMTLNNYALNSFLAAGTSMHNLGVALDLTLEDLDTGEEIVMQSSIHDLSAYSVVPRNNESAAVLAKIMGSAGFYPLFSEWWHFQDNDIRAALTLPSVYPGVSAEGWVADEGGWRYRRETGGFYAGQTVSIGTDSFTFGENGYVQ